MRSLLVILDRVRAVTLPIFMDNQNSSFYLLTYLLIRVYRLSE